MSTTPSVLRKALLTAPIEPAKLLANVEIVEVTLAPRQKVPLHLHPCHVVGLVTEGTIAFQIEGQPIQYLHSGQAFHEPVNARVAHFDNHGDTTAKFVAFYLLGQDEHELIRILE